MKTKQLIERNLKFDQKYIYLELVRGSIESGQLTCCDNCGKLITNMVKVANKETRQRYTIGTDCAETLAAAKCLYNNGQSTDFYLDIYAYNVCARFVTELKEGIEYQNNGVFLTLTNRKGKPMQCSPFDLVKYFPEYAKH